MAFVFDMPEIGEGVVEGEVVAWKVAEGDTITVDQPLCEVMTDKATVEIPSPKAGVVVRRYGEPGDIIKVHTPLVEIDTNGAAAPRAATPAPAKAPAPAEAPAAAAAPVAVKTRTPAPAPSRIVSSDPATRGRTKAAPAVRRHAREAGIDIAAVPGTGKGGRVTHYDLDQAAAPEHPVTPLVAPALPQVHPSGTEERVKIIGLRRKIAQQMVRAKQTAPHYTYVEEVDCTRLVEMRSRLKKHASERGVKLTYMPFVVKACSIVFREFPNVNAVMDEEAFELVVKGDHNIGIATDTPQGLFVPVVKNVEQKSILQIAVEIQDLVARTREGKAAVHELTGGTFTITGVGTIGGVMATPILNVPEVAILGFNAIRDQAVVIDGEIAVRKRTLLSPSFDHRIIDGAVGARFTAALKRVLEEPDAMILDLV